MVVSKGFTQRCDISIGDSNINRVHKINNPSRIVKDNGKCGTEIRSHMKNAKDTFQKLSKFLKHTNISLETNKRKSAEMLCDISLFV